jgi:hypothetical protein
LRQENERLGLLLDNHDDMLSVTPVFPKKTECISYVCQDQNFTHIECNITKLCSKMYRNDLLTFITLTRVDLKVFTRTTITMKTRLHLHLPRASDWLIASSELLVVDEALRSRVLL